MFHSLIDKFLRTSTENVQKSSGFAKLLNIGTIENLPCIIFATRSTGVYLKVCQMICFSMNVSETFLTKAILFFDVFSSIETFLVLG